MTTLEIEQKLSAAFHGGERRKRELRLTAEEATWVSAHCAAQIVPLGGAWYEIKFAGADGYGG